ncbi:MAG: hypothetical protein EOP10_33795 [Proteobacteria bacterium]|nr:MAG: hypothetical protein EOP10_33795 [Pseudomonadota bacterium]
MYPSPTSSLRYYKLWSDRGQTYETAEFTQGNILLQAGSAVLTQANQLPNVALKLLSAVGG